MDRWKIGLDNYITGGRYEEWEEAFHCQECDTEWTARLCREYRLVSYIDDDKSYCPKCGTDIE